MLFVVQVAIMVYLQHGYNASHIYYGVTNVDRATQYRHPPTSQRHKMTIVTNRSGILQGMQSEFPPRSKIQINVGHSHNQPRNTKAPTSRFPPSRYRATDTLEMSTFWALFIGPDKISVTFRSFALKRMFYSEFRTAMDVFGY